MGEEKKKLNVLMHALSPPHLSRLVRLLVSRIRLSTLYH